MLIWVKTYVLVMKDSKKYSLFFKKYILFPIYFIQNIFKYEIVSDNFLNDTEDSY